jgi:hypothetical protein
MARLAQGQATLALFRCKIFTTQNMGMQHHHTCTSCALPLARHVAIGCVHGQPPLRLLSCVNAPTERPCVVMTPRVHRFCQPRTDTLGPYPHAHTHPHTHAYRTTFFNSLLWAWPLVLWPSDMCAASAVCPWHRARIIRVISLLIAPPVLDVHKQLSRTALTSFFFP